MQFSTKLVLGLLIILFSFISVADLIYRPGHPITFDGHIHMTTMNQFAQSLYDGEFPVTWSNNFANFGLPLPLFAHQLPAYLGAGIILLGVSTELAYKILLSLSVILSALLFYKFFRKYANYSLAFTATLLSVFFPYRALNIYTRGGLPEIMASIFLPILLLGVWHLKQKNYLTAVLLIYFGTLLTALTHPMMLVIFSVPVIAYFLFKTDRKTYSKDLLIATTSTALGILSAGHYLFPLFSELKYFYQAGAIKSIVNDSFLSLQQLYNPAWYYTYSHPGPRGNYIKLGLIEFGIILTAIILIIKTKIFSESFIKKYMTMALIKDLIFWTGLSLGLIILITPVSKAFYSLPLVYQIQYPWRFLSALQVTVPLVFIFLVKTIKKLNNNYFLLGFIALILWLRIPQFYGKNYIIQPESDYYFNQANLHSTNFNTVWSDNSENYEKKTVQAQIIEGKGELKIVEAKNASRIYQSNSEEQLRIIDYTFYFPGWILLVDNTPTTIQYQDPNYRGLITYKVPAGSHEIKLRYKYTKARSFGAVMTIIGLSSFIIFFILTKSTNGRAKDQNELDK